jgi:DNA-directed RNA polymerase specialized sigma24 family protein
LQDQSGDSERVNRRRRRSAGSMRGGTRHVVLHYYLRLAIGRRCRWPSGSIGTVKSRLHRALGSMRVAMADDAPVASPS